MRNALRAFVRGFIAESPVVEDKYDSETRFWKEEIENYIRWYNGEISLYEMPSPTQEEKVPAPNLKDSAILTWHKLHQEAKYLYDLQVAKDIFAGKRVLDVASGPMPSATCFLGADLYCLEPLLDRYLNLGFPLHYYGNVKFVRGFAEHMPLPDRFFDAVVSVNALDHVDDFEKAAAEIVRVLKKDGDVLFHLHYHQRAQNEPIELNDDRVKEAFSGIHNFRKIGESRKKMGYTCPDDETFALWTNRS